MKIRNWLLLALLAAGSAAAQQNFDISGKEFQSGAGDAKFATIGRQAAASGKRLVVTAPQQWHKRIAAKIRAGGPADIVLKDGFYETVLVRVENKPAEPPKRPEPKPEPRPTPRPPEPKPVETAKPAPAPAPKPAAPPPPPRAVPKAAPAPTHAPAPAPAPAARAPAAPPKPDVAAIKKRLEQSLNNGHEAEGPLSPGGLQPGDFIFVDGPVRAVVRRESLNPRMFWLDGDLDLRRTELKDLGSNRYQVIEPISGENYALREEREDGSRALVARIPADNAPARASMEHDYNEGHSIDESIKVSKLRAGDIVYAGKGVAVVVRREGARLRRYWLEGSLDLGQSGLQRDGNKYKVLSDTLR